jgi:hypothetical protein
VTHGEPTREQFVREATVRRGAANPERMLVVTWQWLVRDGRSAWQAREHFQASHDAPAGWTFQRFGATATLLPDGRIVCIGGEHEDSYDSDFWIYNDVVVLTPDATMVGGAPLAGPLNVATCGIEILGYEPAVFPPTDSHSATRVGDAIVVIGTIGYHGERRDGATPVHVLDTRTWTMRALPTTGRGPGWISKHAARLDSDRRSLRVAHGQVFAAGGFHANAGTFRLHLADDLRSGRWEETAPCVLRRAAELEPASFESWDPDLAELMPRLGWPSLRVYRDATGIERHQVFTGDAVVGIEDVHGLRVVVEVDADTGVTDPAAAAVVERLLAVAAELGCPQSLRPLRDGLAD